MPLYIADYLRDTTHLGALESGAYLHLIMDYWMNGSLPTDEKKLARIAKMTDREWKSSRETLKAFFHNGWKHKRIDGEIKEAGRIAEANSDKAREAANKRWAKHRAGMHEEVPDGMLGACSEHCSGDAWDDATDHAPECTLHTSHSTVRTIQGKKLSVVGGSDDQ
jgi:uncharacterized protein YdaU (DUF1376 family)